MSITNETRREAFESVLPGLFDRRTAVLDALRAFPEGATAEDVADAVNKPTYQVRPRLTELLEIGKIIVVGKRVSPVTGKKIAVWKVA